MVGNIEPGNIARTYDEQRIFSGHAVVNKMVAFCVAILFAKSVWEVGIPKVNTCVSLAEHRTMKST